jgi:DNA (cytosine-5)-methyltransferase 1
MEKAVKRGFSPNLPEYVGANPDPILWPTLMARDWKETINQKDRGVGSRDDSKLPIRVFRGEQKGATGSLNPAWVEWLMGYPEGWTDLEG